jgi:hypothetical protein
MYLPELVGFIIKGMVGSLKLFFKGKENLFSEINNVWNYFIRLIFIQGGFSYATGS